MRYGRGEDRELALVAAAPPRACWDALRAVMVAACGPEWEPGILDLLRRGIRPGQLAGDVARAAAAGVSEPWRRLALKGLEYAATVARGDGTTDGRGVP